MRSVSAARVGASRSCATPRCTFLLITYERTTNRFCRKATWLNCVATVAEQPPRWAFLQESEHALAGFFRDEQSRRVGAEPLGVAVKALQDGRGGKCLWRGHPLR